MPTGFRRHLVRKTLKNVRFQSFTYNMAAKTAGAKLRHCQPVVMATAHASVDAYSA